METLQEGGFSNLVTQLKAFFFPKTGGDVSGSVTATGKVKAATIEDSDGTLAAIRESVSQLSSGEALPVMSSSSKGGAKLGSGLSVEDDALNLGPLTDSGSGASVQTDGCGIFGVTGEGWSEQDGTTGKNLLDYDRWKGTTIRNGTGTWENNGVTLTATSEDCHTMTFLNQSDYSSRISVSEGDVVRLAWDSDNDLHGYCFIFGNGTTTSMVYTDNAISKITTYNVPAGVTYVEWRLGVVYQGDTIRYSNVRITVNNPNTSYEPYTGGKASPNPDYPQEIRVARGRNLAFKRITGASCDIDGAVVTNASLDLVVAKVDEGKTYTATQDWGNLVGAFYTTEPVIGTASYNNSRINQPSGTFTAPIDGYFGFWVRTGYATPQLELGSTPTPYVPYGHVGLDKDVYTCAIIEAGAWINNAGARGGASSVYDVAWYMPVVQDKHCTVIFDYETHRGSSGTVAGAWYDESKQFISGFVYAYNVVSLSLTVPNGARYLSLTYDKGAALRVLTTTPIPLPAKGFAGALPDGTADVLTLDSAGRWEWVNESDEVVFDGSEVWNAQSPPTHKRFTTAALQSIVKKTVTVRDLPNIYASRFAQSTSIDSWNTATQSVSIETSGLTMFVNPDITTIEDWITWLASNPVTVLYPLAASTTEHGYIALPELPAGATVSIPELEAIGVEWWVEGIPEIGEYGRAMQTRLQEELDEAEQAIAALKESAPFTWLDEYGSGENWFSFETSTGHTVNFGYNELTVTYRSGVTVKFTGTVQQ